MLTSISGKLSPSIPIGLEAVLTLGVEGRQRHRAQSWPRCSSMEGASVKLGVNKHVVPGGAQRQEHSEWGAAWGGPR